MSNELFTGGNTLTGFKKLANDAMMSNELRNSHLYHIDFKWLKI